MSRHGKQVRGASALRIGRYSTNSQTDRPVGKKSGAWTHRHAPASQHESVTTKGEKDRGPRVRSKPSPSLTPYFSPSPLLPHPLPSHSPTQARPTDSHALPRPRSVHDAAPSWRGVGGRVRRRGSKGIWEKGMDERTVERKRIRVNRKEDRKG